MATERKSLSRNLLKMKFMQRTEEAKLRQQLEEEEKREIDEAHWVLANVDGTKNESSIEYEPSFVACENLFPTGRRSFNKFNPTIEKIFKEIMAQKELAECEVREMEDTVTDEQMAKRYDSLIDTVDKKFGSKRKRQNSYDNFEQVKPLKKSKSKFKKPKED